MAGGEGQQSVIENPKRQDANYTEVVKNPEDQEANIENVEGVTWRRTSRASHAKKLHQTEIETELFPNSVSRESQ